MDFTNRPKRPTPKLPFATAMMALLTWIAVWLVSMLMRGILAPVLGPNVPQVLEAGLVSASIVVMLTWVAMPFLVKIAHPWLHPRNRGSQRA
jgi:antibiotic biosynthesis monooxygenase (ABM) superfamily enzyme